MNDDVEVWTMEFQAHVTIILYRNRLGSSFPKCLWKMEDLFNNHADHSCDSWMVPVLNPGVQFNGIIGLCKKNMENCRSAEGFFPLHPGSVKSCGSRCG